MPLLPELYTKDRESNKADGGGGVAQEMTKDFHWVNSIWNDPVIQLPDKRNATVVVQAWFTWDIFPFWI